MSVILDAVYHSHEWRIARSNIIATAKRESDAISLANVNLFLNALGLGIDASQLAAMAS